MACSDRNKGNNLTTERRNKNMETKTTRTELQEPTDASLVCSTSAELLNATSLKNADNSDSPMLCSHSGSEYNLNESSASMSGRIFGKCPNCGKSREKRIKDFKKIVWYSKHFKVKPEVAIPPLNKLGGILAPRL